jgi:hypothetical protein
MLASHVSSGYWLQMSVELAALVANDKVAIALECADKARAASGFQYQARWPVLAPACCTTA